MENITKGGYSSRSIDPYGLRLENDVMQYRIHWARVISSESESLFTQYTKHTFYELQYALEGSICMTVGDEPQVMIRESDFIVIPPDTYHQIVGGDQTGARFIMAFSVQLKDERLRGLQRALGLPRPHDGSGELRELFSLILAQDAEGGIVSPLRAQIQTSLLESFLLKIIERSVPERSALPLAGFTEESGDRRAAMIEAYIHRYHGVGIRVPDVAAYCGISERQLNRILQQHLGKSARELLEHEKLKRMEELMVTTSLSLAEIAELCGFSDGYAMSKFFRKHCRLKPSEFRRLRVGHETK